MKKRYFLQLFISFLSLIILIIILSSFIIYGNYVDEVIEGSSAASEKMLLKTVESINLIWQWASMHAIELYNNNYIFNAIYGSDIGTLEEHDAQRVMSSAINSNPYIYSVYLYNGNMGLFFSSVSYRRTTGEFFDRGIVGILEEKNTHRQFELVSRAIKFEIYGKGYAENVISLILTESVENAPPDGALILNIRVSALRTAISAIDRENDDFFVIVDSKDKIISHSRPEYFLREISSQSYIRVIEKDLESSGYFTESVDGKKYLITYVKSETPEWCFVQASLYSNLFEKTRGIKNLIIVLSILLFVFAALLSVFLCWKLYSPINRLVRMIRQNSASTDVADGRFDDAERNEFDYISHAYTSVIENFEELMQRRANDRIFLKREMLKSVLNGDYSDRREIVEKFAELDIELDPSYFLVLVIRIDEYWQLLARRGNTKDVAVIRFAIANIAEKEISRKFKNSSIDISDDVIAFIVNTRAEEVRNVQGEMISIIREFQTVIANRLRLSVSAALSDEADTVSEIRAVYKAAMSASEYRLLYGKTCIITPDMLQANVDAPYRYPERTEKSILDAIRLHDIGDIEQKTDVFFEELGRLNHDDIMMSIYRLVYSSLKVINRITRPYHEINFRKAQNDFGRLDTLEEIKAYLLDMYRKALGHLQRGSQNAKRIRVRRIEEIVHGNLDDPNLSPDYIATKLFLSVNYVRELFREIKGESLSNYMNIVRCDKAKELLRNSKMTVSEVSRNIGMTNVNYFYTLFKKNSGVTPAQYRTQHYVISGFQR